MVDFLDNRQDIIWTSPSGKEFVLKTLESGYTRKHIGDVKENSNAASKSDSKKSTNKKNAAVSSGKYKKDSNDTFSDLGISGKDVNLEFLFIGLDHYERAKEFEDALCEIGKSKLQLAYGEEFTVNVLNFSVKHDLLEKINKTTVAVNFHQTAPSIYPQSSKSAKNQVKISAQTINETAAQNVSSAVLEAAKNQTRLSNFKNSYSKMMTKVINALKTANSLTVNSILTDILGQDVTSSAYTMTSQLQIAINQAVSLSYKVKGLISGFDISDSVYSSSVSSKNLIESLKTFSDKAYLPTEQIDELRINDATAQAVITSLAQNITETEYSTRKEAIDTANEFLKLADDWENYIEAETKKIEDLEEFFIREYDTNSLVLAAVNSVIEQSYELKVEKKLILPADEAVVNIAYKYYPEEFAQNPDSTIDFLISSNGWDDDLFFLLPKGTEVKIYV